MKHVECLKTQQEHSRVSSSQLNHHRWSKLKYVWFKSHRVAFYSNKHEKWFDVEIYSIKHTRNFFSSLINRKLILVPTLYKNIYLMRWVCEEERLNWWWIRKKISSLYLHSNWSCFSIFVFIQVLMEFRTEFLVSLSILQNKTAEEKKSQNLLSSHSTFNMQLKSSFPPRSPPKQTQTRLDRNLEICCHFQQRFRYHFAIIAS